MDFHQGNFKKKKWRPSRITGKQVPGEGIAWVLQLLPIKQLYWPLKSSRCLWEHQHLYSHMTLAIKEGKQTGSVSKKLCWLIHDVSIVWVVLPLAPHNVAWKLHFGFCASLSVCVLLVHRAIWNLGIMSFENLVLQRCSQIPTKVLILWGFNWLVFLLIYFSTAPAECQH